MHALPPARADRARTRVLVVDDEAHVRELLARWLRDVGYECCCASNVAQALQVLAQGRVDAVTTDINMPDETGAAWLPRLRQAYADMAIVVVTGCDDARTAIQAFEDGACGYMIKPVSQDEFLDQLQCALQRRYEHAVERAYKTALEQQLHELNQSVQVAHEEAAERLLYAAAVHRRDELARLRRIGEMSALVAKAWNRSLAEIDTLRRAAPLLDIGKLATSVARCDEPCDTEGGAALPDQAIFGAEILTGSRLAVLQMAEQIARSYQECWDGRGIPDGLSGERIPWPARIVAVVAAYDAWTHEQPGRPALRDDAALQLLEEDAGQRFDPHVVQALRSVWPRLREDAARAWSASAATAPRPLTEAARNAFQSLTALVG